MPFKTGGKLSGRGENSGGKMEIKKNPRSRDQNCLTLWGNTEGGKTKKKTEKGPGKNPIL